MMGTSVSPPALPELRPKRDESRQCIAKIDEDFAGALPHWKEYFDQWVFVHNSKEGLGPDVTAKLLA